MFTFDATEQINEVSRTRTTTQVITRYFGRWPQTKTCQCVKEITEQKEAKFGPFF